jgi:hypothetical protein
MHERSLGPPHGRGDVSALDATGALDPGLDKSEAADIVYALLSPDVHRILTVERGWHADRYERWIAAR